MFIYDLEDTFDGPDWHPRWSLPKDGWEATVFTLSGGAMRYTDHISEISVDDYYDWPTITGTQWEIDFPESGGQHVRLVIGNEQHSVDISFNNGSAQCTARWDPDGDGSSWGSNVGALFYGDFRHVRVIRCRPVTDYPVDTLVVEVSEDGDTWVRLNTTGDHTTMAHTWIDFQVGLEFGGYSNIHDVHGVGAPPPEPPPLYPETAPDVDDPFLPDALAPIKPGSECATVLDLIREFSAAVRRAVRLIGTNTIEMVDPNAPLPDGWVPADAETLYHAATYNVTAGTAVLSLLAGDLALTASAGLTADDVRVPASTWRIPDRLPLYRLDPAPVQRVTYTFSPHGFTGDIEYHQPSAPLSLRRT